MRSHWFFTTCSLIAAMFVVAAFYVPRMVTGERPGDASFAALSPAAGSAPVRSTGTPHIGGAFHLIDQHGHSVTDASLRGHYSLIDFGYTSCPDICPAALGTVSQAINKLGPSGDQVTPVFITVDPQRDTVAVMQDYASHFHPRLVALTGSPAQVKTALDAYKVYAFSHRKGLEDRDYAVDHSAYLYLMGPDGAYVTHYPYDITPQVLAESLEPILNGGTPKGTTP